MKEIDIVGMIVRVFYLGGAVALFVIAWKIGS